ncbi:MAG: YitT family protein [Bacilli bacterium]|nr:YitT family protein [Bacilli bacterium]
MKFKIKNNTIVEYFINIAIMFFCAIISAFEYKVFIAPKIENAIFILPTGISGLSTIISSIINSIFKFDFYSTFSIVDNILNIPSFIIAFYFFGFKFGLLTTIFVIFANMFICLDFQFANNFALQIANIIEYNGVCYQTSGLLTRAILAACCSGITNSIIISLNASSGGMATINYFLASRKAKNIGYYSIITNATVAILFTIFAFFKYNNFLNAILSLIFALIFVILYAIIIDVISPQNKKEQIQIISAQDKIDAMIKLIPHGITIINSKGAYSKENKVILSIIVSTYETEKTIKTIKQIDPLSFIYVTKIKQAYGGFFKIK